MLILYTILFLLLGGAVLSLLLGSRPAALYTAAGSVIAASVMGFTFSLQLLLAGVTLSGQLPIPLPLGSCLFTVDPPAAVFLLPVFLISGLAALILPSRMMGLNAGIGDQLAYGRHCFFFCTLVLGMVLVLTAADAVFFLISWEVMSLAPFFLLSAHDKDGKERYAAWIYLVAAHLGVLPLLMLFADMSVEAGASGFYALAAHGAWKKPGLLFVLALVGFGVKIGLFPLHVWMPESYPAAPGHVAAVLSGAMVNLGLYGIIRVILLLGPPEIWWAYLLMAVGGVTGVLGIFFAMAQSRLKRVLAYSSAENMGIICLALGSGLLAMLHRADLASVLFLGGALLHMWNHAVFKSLYFIGASHISHSTGTTTINHLGGLHKRMPFAGACTAVASASLAGAPPFNGFMSELLLYAGFVAGALATAGTDSNLLFWAGLFTLGGIAGFSLLCFARVYGLVFLGAPRSSVVLQGQSAGSDWRFVMGLLTALCLVMSLAAPRLFLTLQPALFSFSANIGLPLPLLSEDSFAHVAGLLGNVAIGCVFLSTVLLALFLYRRSLAKRHPAETGLTWDCGYRFPTARMQYTGGGFAEFPAGLLRAILRPRIDQPGLSASDNPFPRAAAARFESPDWAAELWREKLFNKISRLAGKAKIIQQGVVNLYILYILVALLAALVWALGWPS